MYLRSGKFSNRSTRFWLSTIVLRSGLILLLLANASCGDGEKKEVPEEIKQAVSSFTQLPDTFNLSDVSRKEIDTWKRFREFEKEMETFRVKTSGDLSFSTEQLLVIDTLLQKDTIPPKFDNRAIKSRLIVISTFIHKLDAQLGGNTRAKDIDNTREKLMEAYNGLRYQIADVLTDKVYEDFLEVGEIPDSTATRIPDPKSREQLQEN
ncbi:hypothetical protein [Robertkochia solimangrovi]|uniref:hypothetical protein n=1 Tax=Robertkochia solimangrovi TaxID=2213046 RepID=UPI00117CB9D7|nr:hypothetical protein [Robertkochia solimangrovi]TRZ46412.1 hypothetical protein DMZ48_03955 [Robertkochia solimangrovi]